MIKETLCSIIAAFSIQCSNPVQGPDQDNQSEETNNYGGCVLKKGDINKIKARHVSGEPYLCQQITTELDDLEESEEVLTLRYFNKDIFVLTVEMRLKGDNERSYIKFIFEDTDGDGLIERVQLQGESYFKGVKTGDSSNIISSDDERFTDYFSCSPSSLQQMYTKKLEEFLKDNVPLCK
ncbi:MAG: hypothetical protein Q8Q01_05750 [archaeon]|nr:hypothetical protein [archaeon]